MEPIKLVCFDLNKTLIAENTWYELNLAMGISEEEDQEMLSSYKRGEKSYIDWQKEIEQRYIQSGLATKERILKVLYNYKYLTGAKETIKYLKSRGYALVLISGSVDILVNKVATELGIAEYFANNQLKFDECGYLAEIICLGEDWKVKKEQLVSLSESKNIPLNQIVCVGDGDNDQEIFELTGHGITFRNSKIAKYWKKIDRLSDIKNIL